MVVVVLLAISAVLITTQIGHNQLMLRWPLNTLLVILGLSSVSIRMRCMQNLIVTVTSDVLFILLLFINQEYTPGSSTTFADFLSSIGVLIVMSFIFVHSSFQNEALRRSEYVHMRRVMQQNKILQDKLEQVEKQKRAPRPDINMDSPLEKILSRLNIVLAACRTESASKPDVVSNLTEVVQLLEANTESLLRPDLHVRDGAAVDSNAVRFMTTEFQRDEFSGAKSRRAGVGRVSSVPSRYGRHASAIRSAPIKENAQEEPGAVGKKPASLDLGVEKNIVAAELSRTLLVWDVDFLDVNERTGGNAILLLSTALFKEHNLISELGIDTGIFERFFTALQQRYLEVPYHNSAHGADVCHSFYNILIKSNQLPVLQPIELMAALIACFGHDVAHPGFNNSYLINTGAPEAILYNDKAVLENMHVAEIFKLASAPEMNIFHSLSRSQYKAVRSIMIDMILSTDLAKHFEIMSGFKIKLQSVQAGGADAAPSGNWCEKDVLMMLRIIVKIGDIAHFAKTNKLHMRWNDLVLEEFYHQGDLEIERGLEVNPLMDRRLRSGVGANQVFFINLIVKPLFEAAQTAFEGFTPVMKELESNLAFWQAYKGDAEESDIARQSTIEDCLAT
ncbi:Phosphodiesterase [Plasmodiophora brassicae]